MLNEEEEVTQYRIPMVVEAVKKVAACTGGYKDEYGQDCLTYGPMLWWVHFKGSTESLCFGAERPNLFEGETVDVIIRKR